MKPEQFKALIEITAIRSHSKAHEAARMVLVDKRTQTEAAQAVGISQQSVSKAVRRINEAKRLALRGIA